ncbi:ABC transporter substrate-binding protein [Paracoccus sp. APAP_BH8]|nr:ABC transporter substrate-binding protein [Paracoccus pantotrophus]
MTRSRRPPRLRPIHVGLPYPAAGRGASDATEMVNGAALAVAEANARGGIHGRELRLVPKPFHNRDDIAALAAYRALIEEESRRSRPDMPAIRRRSTT